MAAQNKKEQYSAFGIASAYIGALIGVGFSTGQELLTYFGNFGKMGIVGIVVAFGLFAVVGPMGLLVARRLNFNSFDEVITPFQWKPLKIFNLYVRMAFLYVAIASFVAATASLLQAYFGVPYIIGAIAMPLVCILTVFMGQKKLISALSIVVPIMVVIAIAISVMGIVNPPVAPSSWEVVESGNKLIGGWLQSSLLYFGYNIGLAIAVLVPMAKPIKNDRHVVLSGVLAGSITGVMAIVCVISIIVNYTISSTADMPIVDIAFAISPIAGKLYAVVALLAIYTTLVGIINVFMAKSAPMRILHKYKWLTPKTFLLVVVALAIVLSFIGFRTLIGYLYPVAGYAAILSIAGLLFNYFYALKKKRDGTLPIQREKD